MDDKYSVLIADCNKSSLRVLTEYIRMSSEFKLIECAFNGNHAIESALKLDPDLILLDLILPNIDAFGVTEEIRKQQKNKKSKIIIFTPTNVDFVTKRCFASGADFLFLKPVDYSVFIQRSLEVLQQDEYRIDNPQNMQSLITSELRYLGVPASILGYKYLKYGIESIIGDSTLLNDVTKRLYPRMAAKFETKENRIERNIRHAIERTWVVGNIDYIDKIFGYTVDSNKGKPSNAAFMAMVADKINMSNNRID